MEKWFYTDEDGIRWWRLAFVGVAIIAGFWGAAVIGSYATAAHAVAAAPASIISSTYDSTNILNSYEDFRDTYESYVARTDQIKEYDGRVKERGLSQDERADLETELSGQRQSCRDLVARYNGNSLKTNHAIFKNPPLGGSVLPDELDQEKCNL